MWNMHTELIMNNTDGDAVCFIEWTLARLLSLMGSSQKEIIALTASGENQDLSACYTVNICSAIHSFVLSKAG